MLLTVFLLPGLINCVKLKQYNPDIQVILLKYVLGQEQIVRVPGSSTQCFVFLAL